MGKIGLDGVLGGQLCSWTEKHGEKSSRVGLNRVPGGRGYSWTELYLEIIFGQSLWWTESIMGNIGLDGVLGGQGCSWTEKHWDITFVQSPDSLMDRFYNGQSWFGKSPGWPGVHLDRIVF